MFNFFKNTYKIIESKTSNGTEFWAKYSSPFWDFIGLLEWIDENGDSQIWECDHRSLENAKIAIEKHKQITQTKPVIHSIQ